MHRFERRQKSLELSRTGFSLFFVASGDAGPGGFRRARQAVTLREPRGRHEALVVSDARQGGQFAGGLRRKGGGRLGRRNRVYCFAEGGKGALVLRDWQGLGKLAGGGAWKFSDRFGRRQRLCLRTGESEITVKNNDS